MRQKITTYAYGFKVVIEMGECLNDATTHWRVELKDGTTIDMSRDDASSVCRRCFGPLTEGAIMTLKDPDQRQQGLKDLAICTECTRSLVSWLGPGPIV